LSVERDLKALKPRRAGISSGWVGRTKVPHPGTRERVGGLLLRSVAGQKWQPPAPGLSRRRCSTLARQAVDLWWQHGAGVRSRHDCEVHHFEAGIDYPRLVAVAGHERESSRARGRGDPEVVVGQVPAVPPAQDL
jgi:hypothetical protein